MDAARRRRPHCARGLVASLVLALLLVACGDGGTVTWRDLTIDLPEGWVVFDEEPTRLGIANERLGADLEEDEWPEGRVLAMFFHHEPGIRPDDWREYIAERDEAELESDTAIELDGEIPATQLIYRTEGNGTPTREMVVVVPARELEILAQPVPRPDEADAQDFFLENLQTFLDVIESARFGAPVDD